MVVYSIEMGMTGAAGSRADWKRIRKVAFGLETDV